MILGLKGLTGSTAAIIYVCIVFSWWYGAQCFFGAVGCDATPGSRGLAFVFMHVLSHSGGANLLRHTEGATWMAIVMVRLCVRSFVWREEEETLGTRLKTMLLS